MTAATRQRAARRRKRLGRARRTRAAWEGALWLTLAAASPGDLGRAFRNVLAAFEHLGRLALEASRAIAQAFAGLRVSTP